MKGEQQMPFVDQQPHRRSIQVGSEKEHWTLMEETLMKSPKVKSTGAGSGRERLAGPVPAGPSMWSFGTVEGDRYRLTATPKMVQRTNAQGSPVFEEDPSGAHLWVLTAIDSIIPLREPAPMVELLRWWTGMTREARRAHLDKFHRVDTRNR